MNDFLGIIATPLAWILSIIYQFVPSFGWSIVGLTVIVSVALFPLTLKQTRATRAFSAMQPEVKKLQADYKEEPQKLQQEMMRLQKEHGATPAGCLGPMLIQMPIWFALFRLLRNEETLLEFVPPGGLHDAIARGEVDFLGMNLLSTAASAFSMGMDSSVMRGITASIPYVIFILVMVAAQFFQQAYSQAGQARDDNPQVRATQTITKVLPLLFGVFAWNFVAGLVVYWATSNVFRFGQMAFIYRIDGRPTPVATAAPPAVNDKPEPPRPSKPQGSAKKRSRRRRK